MLDKRYLAIIGAVLLLQFSLGERLYAAQPLSHPADVTMTAAHGPGCAGEECQAGDCKPRPCDTGASPACHCSCAQIPSLATSEPMLVASPLATARAGEIPGSATPGRPENPFRPPA